MNWPPSSIPANQRWKNLLVVVMTSKLSRYEKKGITMQPYVEKMYKHELSDTHRQHHGVVDVFCEMARKMGKNVKVRYDDEMTEMEAKDVDLVVTLGKSSFFRSSMHCCRAVE